MISVHIRLRADQHHRLQDLARRSGVSIAEAIRQSVDAALTHFEKEAAWKRARACIGRRCSRKRDVAERHDRYLAHIWSR